MAAKNQFISKAVSIGELSISFDGSFFSPNFNFLFLRFSRNVSEACAWELTLYLILIFFSFRADFFCLDDLFLLVEVLGVGG